jgi:hypothetical protein
LNRHISSTPSRVFEAWTNPELLKASHMVSTLGCCPAGSSPTYGRALGTRPRSPTLP